jgi:hypothetical protein
VGSRWTTFAEPSVLFPGPFGNKLNLNGRCLTNNPVKNLQWAVANPIVRVENRLRSGGATPDADQAKRAIRETFLQPTSYINASTLPEMTVARCRRGVR